MCRFVPHPRVNIFIVILNAVVRNHFGTAPLLNDISRLTPPTLINKYKRSVAIAFYLLITNQGDI